VNNRLFSCRSEIRKVTLSLRSTKHYAMTYGRSGYIEPCFLDLGVSLRWVVSFKPRPLYLRGKITRYPLDTRSRSGRYGEVKMLCCTGTQIPTSLSSSKTEIIIKKPSSLSVTAWEYMERMAKKLRACFTSSLVEDEQPASRSCCFTLCGSSPEWEVSCVPGSVWV
jgi:hypothetical protein